MLFLALATYAGHGWEQTQPVPEDRTETAQEEQQEQGIGGPAEGSDTPQNVYGLFPQDSYYDGTRLSDNGTMTFPEGDTGSDSQPRSMSLRCELDDYLDRNFPRTGLPGVAVIVVNASGTQYQKLLGDITSEHDTMLIGSLTKSFCAISVLQLAQEGALDLDTPVSQYVPSYGTDWDVTVRSLLNQTSGFGYYESLSEAHSGPMKGRFSYSNANYDLLGHIVDAVSGEPYTQYVEEHVLIPLGMDDSGATLEDREAVHGHRNYFGWPVADGFARGDSDDAWGSASSGYMCTSPADFAKYLQMYLNQGSAMPTGGAQILQPASVRAMFLSRVLDPTSDSFYGMGWSSFYTDSGELILSHDGDVENGVARMMILPQRGIALAVLGDAADAFGGNDAFYAMAGGVVACVMGAEPDDVSPMLRIQHHLGMDFFYFILIAIAVIPIVCFGKWKQDVKTQPHTQLVWRLITLQVLFPLTVYFLPIWQNYTWRDTLTFMPDFSIVCIGCIVVSVACGIAKAVVLVRSSGSSKAVVKR